MLHISRADNPYLQVLSSQDNLDRDEGDSSLILSPEPLSSPSRSCGGRTPLMLEEIHSHLVRSPPPVSWPLSPRSNGTFSPDSGSEMDRVKRNSAFSPPLNSSRSQSVEHILSPCKELLKSGMMSPGRGATPDLLLANDSGYYSGGGSISQATSPRCMSSSVGPGASFDFFQRGGRTGSFAAPSGIARQLSYEPGKRQFYHTMSMYSAKDEDGQHGAAQMSSNQRKLCTAFFSKLILFYGKSKGYLTAFFVFCRRLVISKLSMHKVFIKHIKKKFWKVTVRVQSVVRTWSRIKEV